jgi:hypothetical protein
MLNLFQHIIKSNGYETLKRVQGDKITITIQSLMGEGVGGGENGQGGLYPPIFYLFHRLGTFR